MRKVDFLIVGQGLAGTTLAWELRVRSASFVVIDRGSNLTSSRIAAGLITPVTGQRLVQSWRYRELLTAAVRFYRNFARTTGVTVLHERPMIRLLANESEEGVYRKQLERNPELKPLTSPIDPPLNAAEFGCSTRGFLMPGGMQLDVRRYLDVSREWFENEAGYQQADLHLRKDLSRNGDWVVCEKLGLQARRVILCQGFEGRYHPWFPEIRVDAAKGEILTLSLPHFQERRILHRGIWLAHVEDSVYRLGATYDRENLNSLPTPEGQALLLAKLGEMLSESALQGLEILDHQAAVRPIVVGRHPIVGLSRVDPHFGYFNGLGSKGSLQAPWIASRFAASLLGHLSLDPEINLNQRFPGDSMLRLTDEAHRRLDDILQPGDIVIDATAGNGHDTQFLAEQVGPTGKVFAFDAQRSAIVSTRSRLEKYGFPHVELLHQNHAKMREAIPQEHHQNIAAVMFNLGYLPGGNKLIMTQPDSTLQAIQAALSLLKPGGLLTLIAYPGHAGGDQEAEAVSQLLGELSKTEFSWETVIPPATANVPPILHIVQRLHPDAEDL